MTGTASIAPLGTINYGLVAPLVCLLPGWLYVSFA